MTTIQDKRWPHVLLVDDDRDHSEIVTLTLQQQFPSLDVTVAARCAQAVLLDPTQFDIALVDLNLPDGSGLDVLAAIRQKHDLPVILVTGELFGDSAIEGINAGATDYLVKHGDYLKVLPILVTKTLAMERIKAENRRLEGELRRRNIELERLNRELTRMASRDPLTNLYNRRHFNELFRQLFAESDRHGTDLTCLMMDLDGFKMVNDQFGHPAGDRLLVLAAESIAAALRTSDVVARYGGDEFVALLPRTAPDEAQQTARRIRSAFRDTLITKMPEARFCSLSIGMASRVQHAPKGYDVLLRMADDALYQAKASGKDRIVAVQAEPNS